MSQKRGSKGVYKYYQIIFRKKGSVTPEMLEGMKLAVWRYMEDISIGDIISAKVSKPPNLRFRSG